MSVEEIPLDFHNIRELYDAYMPYLKNGGLFVGTTRPYPMDEPIVLIITLPDALEPEIVPGKVVWITPQAKQSTTPCGIGVGFADSQGQIQARIEKLLGSMLNSGQPTFTM